MCAFKREGEKSVCAFILSVMWHGSCVPTLSKQKKKRFSFSNGAKISKKVEHTVAEMREAEQQQPENANSFTLGVSEGAGPEHLVVLVNGIVGRCDLLNFFLSSTSLIRSFYFFFRHKNGDVDRLSVLPGSQENVLDQRL